MKQLQLIEESYTCLDKPLLEYVYEVDNYFLPDYQDLSSVLEIFVNRYIDIKTLAPEHFEKNNTGRIWIKKRRVKTGVLSRIPLLPIAKLILDRYTGGEKLLPIQDPADRKGVINETYHWWLL